MTEADPYLARLRDSTLAPHVVSARPVWLWAADGAQILWANAAGAAALADSPAALAARRFSPGEPLRAQISRLAATLPKTGTPRLERLRGMASIGRPLACACSWLALADGSFAVLVVATEPGAARLSLAERTRRVFAACETPLAVFSSDGTLIHTTADAGDAGDLAALGTDPLAAEALSRGRASQEVAGGTLTIERMGGGADTVLLATWIEHAAPAAEPPPPAEVTAREPDHEAASAADVTPTMVEEATPEERIEAVAETADGDGERLADIHPAAAGRGAGRRHPLRFVWQMEADGQFTFGSPEFPDAVGPRTAALVGQPWERIAAELAVDPAGRIAQAVASRETWSGIDVFWPVDTTGERVAVELSGLPVFDRDRRFRGYRGFGVCRDVTRLPGWPHDVPAPVDAPPIDENPEADPALPPETPVADSRPLLTVVPAEKNVVPFRSAGLPAERRPALTPVERTAFREIGKALGRDGEDGRTAAAPPAEPHGGAPTPAVAASAAQEMRAAAPIAPAESWLDDPIPSAYAPRIERPRPIEPPPATAAEEHEIIDRLPLAVLVHRAGRPIYANRALFEWTGYADVGDIAAAGGIDVLFAEPGGTLPDKADDAGRVLALATRQGDTLAVEARLFAVSWDAAPALALVLVRGAAQDRRDSELALRAAEAEGRELRSIIDTASDGVVVVERDGRIVSLNRRAEALFGHVSRDLEGHPFVDLFAPESHRIALDQLDALSLSGAAAPAEGGREVIGRARQGDLVALFMTIGRVGEGKYCAVFRDITQWKRSEEALVEGRRRAEKAVSAKSDLLARIGPDLRTPLDAMTGLSEAMMQERHGPLGNERYRAHARDIHAAALELAQLIGDVTDLSRIEAGKLDLVFAEVDLNELTRECVAVMQPQANRERIIIRTSLSQSLPAIVADAQSVRQIVLNLLSNSIKLTGAGGQVIVSTALSDRGEAVIRVRDTGMGMSEAERAREPSDRAAASGPEGAAAGGLGLPLTRALAEANRATFAIESAANAGTLVEITFPALRIPAE